MAASLGGRTDRGDPGTLLGHEHTCEHSELCSGSSSDQSCRLTLLTAPSAVCPAEYPPAASDPPSASTPNVLCCSIGDSVSLRFPGGVPGWSYLPPVASSFAQTSVRQSTVVAVIVRCSTVFTRSLFVITCRSLNQVNYTWLEGVNIIV